MRRIMQFHPSKSIRKLLKSFGYDILRYHHRCHPVARRYQLLHHNKISLVFDVGGNVGRYGIDLRDNGYTGKIVSFEPLETAYKKLASIAAKDALWVVENIALGDSDTETILNVSHNGASSSILDMLPLHTDAIPEAKYVRDEKISVQKLDTVFHKYYKKHDRCFLKIDTQGYEKKVIDGSKSIVDQIVGIQLEVALSPLYEGETLINDMIQILTDLDFRLMSIEPGFSHPVTGQLLQADCIFYRPEEMQKHLKFL